MRRWRTGILKKILLKWREALFNFNWQWDYALGGDADDNQDKKLTIGELGKYVQAKVKEQAAIEGREQIPELQGDTEKVLVQC
jgi:hypothetical protein